MITLVNVRSLSLSSQYTILTQARLAAGFPTGAPWIRSFSVLTRRLLVFSARTKLMASIRLDFPKEQSLKRWDCVCFGFGVERMEVILTAKQNEIWISMYRKHKFIRSFVLQFLFWQYFIMCTYIFFFFFYFLRDTTVLLVLINVFLFLISNLSIQESKITTQAYKDRAAKPVHNLSKNNHSLLI